jgi:hypothetical protein
MPGPGESFASGETEVETEISEPTRGYADGAVGVDYVKTPKQGGKGTVKVRALSVVMLTTASQGTEHPGTPVRRLTIDEAHDELMYHEAQGSIALVAGSKYEPQPDGSIKRPSEKHAGLANVPAKDPSEDANENVLVRTGSVISGVRIVALLNFPWPKQLKWGKKKQLLLNFRHAVALVRLCRMLYHKGYRVLYSSGISGDPGRNDCHGWGRAIDIAGVATEMPEQKPAPWRVGKDFIVLYDWGQVHMWDGSTTSGAEAGWQRLSQIDDGYDYVANPSGRVLKYRLKPAERFWVKGKEVKDSAQIAHLVTASGLFQEIYDFACAHYSDSNRTLGPLPAGETDTATPIDSHSRGMILHPDYAFSNKKRKELQEELAAETDPEKKKKLKQRINRIKNDRLPHNNHYHIQLGRVRAPK